MQSVKQFSETFWYTCLWLFIFRTIIPIETTKTDEWTLSELINYTLLSTITDDDVDVDLCLPATSNRTGGIQLRPFVSSNLVKASYQNYCSIPFMYLYKNTDFDALLLMMQVDLNSHLFTNLHKVTDMTINNIYVIVHAIAKQSGFYQLSVNSNRLMTFSLANQTSVDIVVRRNYKLNDRFDIQLFDADNRNVITSLDTDNSYTVTCISYDLGYICEPQFNTDPITCLCYFALSKQFRKTNHTGVILPVVLILIFMAILFYVIIREKVVEKTFNKQPEEQLNLILCMPENAVYEYNLIFRVGCPTWDFDMKNNYIDFEILDPNKEIIGTPVRFSCNELPDTICGEMHCLIGRISAMPPIYAIRANHNDPNNNSIFFYEWVLMDLNNSSMAEKKIVMEYIENKPRLFYGKMSQEFDANDDVGMYPELPVMELTRVEFFVILTFIILFIAASTMLFEFYNLYFTSATDDGSLLRSVQDVIFITLIALPVLMGTVLTYKYYIKRMQLRYDYSVTTNNNSWGYISKSFLIFLGILCLICILILILFGLQITFILSLFWYSSLLVISVIVLGIWAVSNKGRIIMNYIEGTEARHSSAKSDAYSKKYLSKDTEIVENKTIYFSQKTVKLSKAGEQSFGPRMVNPLKGSHQKNHNKSKSTKNAKNSKMSKKTKTKVNRKKASKSHKKHSKKH